MVLSESITNNVDRVSDEVDFEFNIDEGTY